MSRPKPTILVEVTDKATYKTEQVLASDWHMGSLF